MRPHFSVEKLQTVRDRAAASTDAMFTRSLRIEEICRQDHGRAGVGKWTHRETIRSGRGEKFSGYFVNGKVDFFVRSAEKNILAILYKIAKKTARDLVHVL